MKSPRLLFMALLCASLGSPLLAASTGPLRVLHLGLDGTDSARHAHVLMRELGRDAIWFDYISDAKALTPEFMAKFDAILLDAPKAAFPPTPVTKTASLGFTGDERNWASPDFLKLAKDILLRAAGDERRKSWEAFLAGREPEKREARPTVANYENRPEPVTFQFPFSVKGSMERTQVPADMRLELFVAEPDIAKPIAFAWDERGRLWVCETRDYPHGVQSTGEGRDSIKICEDTNGDGKADKFTVFAEKLNIPTSLVFVNGGVIVSQPPRFLFLKDSNGDDKADIREEIMTGWGIGDTHAQANNLHYGYDNWLYGCVGYSGFNGEIGGVAKRFSQGTFRFKADGSALEFLHQFSNNSWGHSANEAGDQFGGTANGAPIFFGGIPATAAPPGVRVMTAKKINEVDQCHTITPNFRQVDVFGGYTAAAGSAFIHSGNLPPRMQGMAMVCEPTMKNIALMAVQPKGAGYTAKDGFNLVASSDEWMSPVFAEVGPDGAVWFADFQNFIIQHNPTPSVQRGGYAAKTGVGGAHENPLRDHERGRIYRVVWNNAKPASVKSLKGVSTGDLVKALGNDNQFWRLTAQRMLVEEKRADAVDALKKTVLASDSGVAAVHALWTLHGLGKLDDATHKAALLARNAALRRNATRALPTDKRGKQLFFSSGVVSDPDLITRLAGLVKLAEFETTKDIQTVVASLSKSPENRADEWLGEATKLLVRKHNVQAYKEGPNLLPNPGFETVGADGLPEGWKRRDYQNLPANAEARWEIASGEGMARTGKNAMRCVTRANADTSFYADVELKPNTQYRLSGWVKTRALRGKVSLNDHIGRAETDRVTDRERDWTQVDVTFNSGNRTRASINILHVAIGDGFWDDVKLCELLPAEDTTKLLAADSKRGENVFFKHTAACVLCHSLKGEGSTVGPPLDGIALKPKDYLMESLTNPSAKLAPGYEQLGVSPMPPMNVVLNEQEMADIIAFLGTLKTPLPPGTVIKPNLPSFE
jgi:putative membrane-bound dehydrogenase-like protein